MRNTLRIRWIRDFAECDCETKMEIVRNGLAVAKITA